jgi:probable rRNA maturation factor
VIPRARLQVARSVRGRVPPELVHHVRHRLRRAVACLGRGAGTLTVRLCDDAEIAALHRQTMGLSGPTDVLSFPAASVPGQGALLGDIVVSWDAVLRQSAAATPGAWLEEVTQLVIHGLAHLHGHDHATRAQGRAMLRTEQRAARAARGGPVVRPY